MIRIQSIHIDGFGALRNKKLEFDGPLTVVYGPNEAGKSTVMAFIRAVLFGFAARGTAERNEPEDGGPFGGFLVLETDDGQRLRVERRDAVSAGGRARAPVVGTLTVTLPDGTRGGEELLSPLLGGISGELFNSLFAFGLGELQEIRTLQSDEVSGYLYGAGLGANGKAVLGAERRLEQEMGALFKPRGRQPSINVRLTELDRLENELRRSREQIDVYSDMRIEAERMEQDITDADARLGELRKELADMAARLEIRPQAVRLDDVVRELSELPSFESFPADAGLRYEKLQAELRQVREEEERLQLRIRSIGGEAEAVRPDELAVELLPALDELGGRLGDTIAKAESWREEKAALARQREELGKQLRRIDAGWTAENLRQFPLTLAVREQARVVRERVEALRRELDTLEAACRKRRSECAEAAAELEELSREGETIRATVPTMSWTVGSGAAVPAGERLRTDIRELRERWSRLDRLRLEERHAAERLLGWQPARSRSADVGRSRGSGVGAPASIAGWMMVALGIALPAFLWWNGQMPAAVATFAVLAGGGIYALLLGRREQAGREREPQTGAEAGLQREAERLAAERAALERELHAETDRLTAAKEVAAALGAGFQATAALDDSRWLDRLERFAEAVVQAEARLKSWTERLVAAERRHDRAVKLAAEEVKELSRVELTLAEVGSEWERLLERWGLPRALPPEAGPDLLRSIEQAQQSYELVCRSEDKLAVWEAAIRRFEREAAHLLGESAADTVESIGERLMEAWEQQDDRAGTGKTINNVLPPDSDWSGPEPGLAGRLKRRLEEARSEEAKLRESRRLKQLLAEAEEELQWRRSSGAGLERQIRELWRQAGAVDEESFLFRVSQESRARELRQEERQLKAVIRAALGNDSVPSAASLPAPVEAEARIGALRTELREQELEQDGRKERKGRLAAELEKLERGAEHADRLQRREELLSTLHDEVARWAVNAFGSALIRRTREWYERERQPGVLLAASRTFARITEGKYVRILIPFGEKRVAVERADGAQLDSSRLSRGTAEQLYLAMRFALAEEFARSTALPLIMDDVFVNFDRERLARTAGVLCDIAGSHQLLYFTCHEHVVDRLRETGLDFREIRLA